MTPTNGDDRTDRERSEGGSRPQYPGVVDWLVPAALVLIGLAVVVGGIALFVGADYDLIREAVADGAIQSDVFTGDDLVDVTYATAWWSGVGLVVTGVAIWLAAVWFHVLRRRERRLEADGEAPSYVWSNAIVGAVAAIVLGFVPFSQALGGAIAGWLHRDGRDANVKVGGLSGLLTGLPITMSVVFVFVGVIDGSLGVADGSVALLFGAVLAFVVVFTLLFVTAVGAIGGWIGGRIAEPGPRNESRSGRRDSRRSQRDSPEN